MGLFQKQQNVNLTPRQIEENKFRTCRYNLLLVIIFTIINMILTVAQSGYYFLFSASMPYFLTDLGMVLCGKYPPEYYVGSGLTEADFFPDGFLIAMIVISAIILVLYFLCWLFSKKHKKGWIITALILFAIDTAFMFLTLVDLSSIIDILFHAWVIYYLIIGISAIGKLSNMKEETDAASEAIINDVVTGVWNEPEQPQPAFEEFTANAEPTEQAEQQTETAVDQAETEEQPKE